VTAEPEARPAPPTDGEAASPVPVVRAVARVVPVVPKVRARASVPGAIDPAHRDADPYVSSVPHRSFAVQVDWGRDGRLDRVPSAGVKVEPRQGVQVVRERVAAPAEQPTPAGEEKLAERRSIGKAAVGRASLIAPPRAAYPHREIIVTPSGPVPAAPDVSPAREAAPVKPDGPKKHGWRQRALLPVVVGIAAAFTAGTGYLAIKQPPLDPEIGRWGGTHGSVAPLDAAPFAVPGASSTTDPFGAQGGSLTGVPTRLRVEAIGLNTSLESLRLDRKGELTAPENFGKAGWYADGTRPGDVGPAIIAGHVDSWKGPAAFYRLRELEAGDKIEVTRGGRTVRFTVTSTAWYPKTAFPTAEVYGPTPDRQLRLITCGGVFDHSLRSYEDNLVVYAVAG
jgi:hypothetical protein